MKLARVSLASMLLVWVPLADAATCASDDMTKVVAAMEAPSDTSVDASIASSGEADHDANRFGDSQHCVHGHCHHATPLRDGERHIQAMTEARSRTLPRHTDSVPTHVSAGLDRPPKA